MRKTHCASVILFLFGLCTLCWGSNSLYLIRSFWIRFVLSKSAYVLYRQYCACNTRTHMRPRTRAPENVRGRCSLPSLSKCSGRTTNRLLWSSVHTQRLWAPDKNTGRGASEALAHPRTPQGGVRNTARPLPSHITPAQMLVRVGCASSSNRRFGTHRTRHSCLRRVRG